MLCIGYVFTHYSPDEHDLFKLRKEAEQYEPLLKEIFPIDSVHDKEDFSKLSRAYIGARYIKSYTVEKKEIEKWKGEAEKLLKVTKHTCEAKIDTFKVEK